MNLIGLKTCSICKEIEKRLNQMNITYTYQDVRKNRPTEEQIAGWLLFVEEKNIKKLLNTSGKVYKSQGLKDKWESMSLDEKIKKLAGDGMLLKRPILEFPCGKILIGNEVKAYLIEGEYDV